MKLHCAGNQVEGCGNNLEIRYLHIREGFDDILQKHVQSVCKLELLCRLHVFKFTIGCVSYQNSQGRLGI